MKFLRENLQAVGFHSPSVSEGMDILIVSTNTADQALYWERRLDATRGQVLKTDAIIVTIHEDWSGGAGNGLGTLYAYQQARLKLLNSDNIDIADLQAAGASVGLYHTAGKGTRLAPLPGSEHNNKAAVKLPGIISINGQETPITILEAVIRQTSVYAASRQGRLSVFWGDQIFIPSANVKYTAKHHVDILGKLQDYPSAEQWEARGLQRYGLLLLGADGEAKQIEKVSYADFEKACSDGKFGMSLGAFSLSYAMTRALVSEFSVELEKKQAPLSSDYHFWMPLTLGWKVYSQVFPEADEAHYARMQAFKTHFLAAHPQLGLLGVVDIGKDSYWWDYGQVQHYMDNNLRLLGDGEESHAMRSFFGITEAERNQEGSILLACQIGSGGARDSVLVGVQADSINVSNSVVINTLSQDLTADQCLLYNVVEAKSLRPRPGSVRADVFLAEHRRHFKLYTERGRDGSQDWASKILSNPLTFADLYSLNGRANLDRANRWAVHVRSRAITSRKP